MKIYDCFMFWNEIDLLYIRLDILYNYVYKFIICESKESHSKRITKDEYVFIKNKELYEKFMDKIIFIPIEKLPFEGDTAKNNNILWKNENWQRKYLFNGIKNIKNINNNDIIAISDLDEIYDPKILPYVFENISKKYVIGCIHKLFYYYVNNLKKQNWKGTFFIENKNIINPELLQDLRNSRNNLNDYCIGGWHYSWMGGLNRIQEKFKVVAEHDIINQFDNKKHISNVLKNNSDLFNRKGYFGESTLIDIHKDNNSPENINHYIEKFPYLLYIT